MHAHRQSIRWLGILLRLWLMLNTLAILAQQLHVTKSIHFLAPHSTHAAMLHTLFFFLAPIWSWLCFTSSNAHAQQ